MITLETGVPGAGKTLYCVDKLLRALVNATVKHENENGEIVEIPRVIYTNINGLLLDHQKIGPDELNNWHTWAKPGAVIVYDEIQKPWPLAATGSKVPDCIQALETHRHMGVDFIVLTQHPMLIHANLVRLIGRHLHVRRMGNMGLAIVYEWDSCSKTLLYKNALAKSPYRYSKEVFKLYKSAELHTKQPRKIPTLVFFVLFGIIGLIFMFPGAYASIQSRINPKTATVANKAVTVEIKHEPASKSMQRVSDNATDFVAKQSGTNTMPPQTEPKFAGCAASKNVCRCYAEDASPVEKPAEFCSTASLQSLPAKAIELPETLQEYKPPPVAKAQPLTLPQTHEPPHSSLADVVAMYR